MSLETELTESDAFLRGIARFRGSNEELTAAVTFPSELGHVPHVDMDRAH